MGIAGTGMSLESRSWSSIPSKGPDDRAVETGFGEDGGLPARFVEIARGDVVPRED